MKILVIGDSHGNIANLKHVMGFAKQIKASAVIHTGDWNNYENIKIVTDFGIPLYSCSGNADIDPRFNFEKKIKLELDSVKIGVVHKFNDFKNELKNMDIIFSGHYHSQLTKRYTDNEGNFYNIVQPGALENGINFAVFDTKTKMVEFINHDKI